jgi:predicted NBD/HSP70 family sugar kinase
MDTARRTTHEILGAAAVRAQHSRLILNLLWTEKEISRADLARRTSLSRSTVSAIVTDLLITGLVKEAHAGVSSGGRRPILLQFQDQASFIVGVELGATHVSCVLTDLRCNVRASWSAPAPVREEPEVALKQMTMGVHSVLEAILPKWEGRNIASHLEGIFKRPVFVDNDANLGALAELWWGAGSSARDLAYIKVATGIGAGLIINGRIFRGSGGIAGEVGHTSIDPNGPRCICGLRGCLTTFVGTPALLERAKDTLRESGSNRPAPTSIDELVNAALEGEPSSVELMRYTGNKLGIGIANLLNLLNPKMVVLGGGIARAGDPTPRSARRD